MRLLKYGTSQLGALKATDCVFHAGQVCNVLWNIYPGFTCRTTIFFSTPKDNSLINNNLPLNTCFSNRNVFQNGVSAFAENAYEKLEFLSKSSKFCTFWIIRFGSNFAKMWSRYVSNNVWRGFRLLVSALAMAARKSCNGKVSAKIDFPTRPFMLPLLTLTSEV